MKFISFLLQLLFLVSFLKAQLPNSYYASASNLYGIELKNELHSIIDNHTIISYAAIWNTFKTTDSKSNGSVWDIYSDTPNGINSYEYSFGTNQCGNYSSEGDCYNREHSFPQSWFNKQSPMVSDLFQVYPTDGYVNGKRGNYPFGETNNPTWTSSNGSELGPCFNTGYTGTVFEPIDAYKGDLARTYFYMATRYLGEDGNWAGSPMVDGAEPKEWALAMLLNWHLNDPVSQKEIDRNDSIYILQGNRNPFIDHPEYVGYIWTEESPNTNVSIPDNHVTNFSSSFIELEWTDAKGENLPSGYLIVYNNMSFESLPVPTDGISTTSYSNAMTIEYGYEKCTLTNLENNSYYYIKIYSFTGSANSTDYKTDGAIPQLLQKTH